MFYKKTSNGKYRYYEKYYDESEGKWKQATITLNSKTRQAQGEARRKLEAKIEKKLLEDDVSKRLGQKANKITVKEVYEEYRAFRKQELKDSTFSTQENALNSILVNILDKRIRSISSSYFQKIFMLSSNSLSYKRLQKTIISSFFKYAIKIGYIDSNPIDRVELPKQRKEIEEIERKRAKFFSREEMALFKQYFGVSSNEIRMNLLIEFMYFTGLRIGEAIALMWENIDLDNRCINVKYNIDHHSASLKSFKLTSPKTENSYRKISINTRCVEILLEMKAMNLKITPLDQRFIFLGNTGNLIYPERLNVYLKKIGKIACIANKNPEDFSSHMLRHSHISLLTELGVPIKAIMERVGHKDEKTTIQIYTHVTEKMRSDVSDKLENI
ncbi:site-specific integrase [Pseudolactococcus yaeyamensis]